VRVCVCVWTSYCKFINCNNQHIHIVKLLVLNVSASASMLRYERLITVSPE